MGTGLGLGVVVAYLSVFVLLPLAAVISRSLDDGGASFWDAVTTEQARSALVLSLVLSAIVTAINVVADTAIAWVLTRDRFRGRDLVNSLIDLPFALPTIVAGLTLLALYGPQSPVGVDIAYTPAAIALALAFVTLPFVIRAAQPLLESLDRDMEQAAASLGAGRWTIFCRVVMPNLAPGIITGAGLGFAKAVGEFGSVVLISGNIPFQTEVASVRIFGLIESDQASAAAAVSVVLLGISLAVLLLFSSSSAGWAAITARGSRRPGRLGLRVAALGYLALVLAGPLVIIFWRAFGDGVGAFWDSVTSPAALHALWLTTLIILIAVPANTVFGVLAAVMIVRRRVPGRTLLTVLIDLPLALSPVVIGLSIVLVWGFRGWFGGWLAEHGIRVIFALPGMILATIVVSLPFVVREVIPVLREVGAEQEEAAMTLGASPGQTFLRITLPGIRWGVAYGVVLTTARALGEYGAIAVVSGRIQGTTQTMILFVDESYTAFDRVGAYSAAVVLAVLSLLTVLAISLFRPHEDSEQRVDAEG